jgi:hypothetical protein
MALEAISVASRTVDYMENELNGELKRRAQGARIVSVSHTVALDGPENQIYSVVVIIER